MTGKSDLAPKAKAMKGRQYDVLSDLLERATQTLAQGELKPNDPAAMEKVFKAVHASARATEVVAALTMRPVPQQQDEDPMGGDNPDDYTDAEIDDMRADLERRVVQLSRLVERKRMDAGLVPGRGGGAQPGLADPAVSPDSAA